MNMYTKTIFIALLAIFAIPSVVSADYITSYNKVVSDYERALNQFSGMSGNRDTEGTGEVVSKNSSSITPPLVLPQVFNKKQKATQDQTDKTVVVKENTESRQVSENTDNKVAYQSGSVKNSLRREGGSHLSASVVNTGGNVGYQTQTVVPYGTLFVIILMLVILVMLAHITLQKRRRLEQRRYAEPVYYNEYPPVTPKYH